MKRQYVGRKRKPQGRNRVFAQSNGLKASRWPSTIFILNAIKLTREQGRRKALRGATSLYPATLRKLHEKSTSPH